MFDTQEGGKTHAAKLQNALQNGSGILFPYLSMLDVMGVAAGFASWRELTKAKAMRTADEASWRRRLLAALPLACHPPTIAWLNKETQPPGIVIDDVPPRWYFDVSPYWMASMGLHRRHTALIRRGSGPGQVLREALIVGLLINQHGGPSPTPRLEPHSLSLVYCGDLASLYGKTFDHPDFQTEFDRLVEADLLDWRPDDKKGPTLWVTAPPGLQNAVEERAVDMVLHWLEADPDSEEVEIRLAQMLRVLRIDHPETVAKALLLRDAGAHTSPIGPMSSILSRLAAEGSLRSFALVVDLFGRIHAHARDNLASYLPAKVVSQYLPRIGVDTIAFQRWSAGQPGWADALRAASRSPDAFIRAVQAIEADVRDPGPELAA